VDERARLPYDLAEMNLDLGKAKDNAGMDIDMRIVIIAFRCLIGFGPIAIMAGCATTTTSAATQVQACPPGAPPGTPWVPADYANGKWVPGHCLGYPAQ
jgi:hypothetical protein